MKIADYLNFIPFVSLEWQESVSEQWAIAHLHLE